MAKNQIFFSSQQATIIVSLLLPFLYLGVLQRCQGGTVTQDGVIYTTYSDHAVISRLADNYSSHLVIPSYVNGLKITEVAKKAFSEVRIEELILPDTVTILRSSAFDACTIHSITLGNGLKTIEQWAFDDCYGLKSLTIPASVTSIGRGAFDIDDLESISLPSKCTLASSDLFDDEAPLKSIYIRGGKPNYTINFDSFIPKPTIYLEVAGLSTLWGCPVEYNNPNAVANISISGDVSIAYGGNAAYTCKATYKNGTTATVTPVWSLSSTNFASVTTTGKVTNKNNSYTIQAVSLNASYTKDGMTKTDSVTVLLEGKPNELTDLQIVGEASTAPGVDTRYAAQARYANGDNKPVTPEWSIVSGGQFASISADGILHIASLPVEMAIVICATYTDGGVTKETTRAVNARPAIFTDTVFEYTYVFQPGWQQVCIVLNLDSVSKEALLALQPFIYQDMGYELAHDLPVGTSCWIFVSQKTTIKVSGTPCGVLKTIQ